MASAAISPPPPAAATQAAGVGAELAQLRSQVAALNSAPAGGPSSDLGPGLGAELAALRTAVAALSENAPPRQPLAQPLKNLARIFREKPEVFTGHPRAKPNMVCVRDPSQLVNMGSPDGLFGLGLEGGDPCAICEMVAGLKEEDSYNGYKEKHGSPPFGRACTKRKPFDMVIRHAQAQCPFAKAWTADYVKMQPASANVEWIVETEPRDPFEARLDAALIAAGKPQFTRPGKGGGKGGGRGGGR